MSGEIRAIVITLLLVVFAAGVGVAVGERARPSPTPAPSPTARALPSATPLDPAEVQRRAFAQPLVAGCATAQAVWIVADGGAVIRWDGRTWTIPDPTLRSLLAAQCDGTTALAVGRGGSLVTIDDDLRQVRVDRFGLEDLNALARFPGGAVAVGAAGAVAEQSAAGWRLVPAGASDDLRGVAVSLARAAQPGVPEVWIVGAGGSSYRFVDGAWLRTETGVTETLHAVAMQGGSALAVGDGGTVLRFTGARWQRIGGDRAGLAPGPLRAVEFVGSAAWIVGDRGFVMEQLETSVRVISLDTTCTLRAVFAQGSAVWVVGSDGTRGGAWRIAPTGTDRWGTC